ncbi:MAG: NAD-glutamate dehydrogenase, partial [Deltaproteobacteria bacterium]|nr:NAD-glutamate dehydrogenase [Deltaproteobacteria bacterium]
MQNNLDRAELVGRLLAELESPTSEPGSDLLPAFAKALLRRVDDAYLFRHRLTTLGAQLSDSYRWFRPAVAAGDVAVRVFRPEVATHGYAVEGVVIETVMPDQPFIYDTLKLTVEQLGLRVLNNLRVVIPVQLEGEPGQRQVTNIGESSATTESFGYTRWYVTWDGSPTAEGLTAEVSERLVLARAMVSDFNRMIRDLRATANEFDYLAKLTGAPRSECVEVRDFVHWLLDENFVFMGLQSYTRDGSGLVADTSRSLGIARFGADGQTGVSKPAIDADEARFLAEANAVAAPLARVHKSSIDSVIHRRGKVDHILIRTFDPDGRPVGGLLVHGMFAHKGLSQPGGQIPILRGKLERMVALAGTRPGDYDHKSLISAFNALPVEYLFEADETTVFDLLQMSRAADDRHEFRSHLAISPDGHSGYVFVVVPKENYADELRAQLQSMLQAELAANYADHRVHFGKYGSVAIHFYLTADQPLFGADLDQPTLRARTADLERKLAELGTPWVLRLRRALEAELGEATGAERHASYAAAFPENYTEVTAVDVAVVDIQHLDKVVADGRTRFDIFPSNGSDEDALLRIYSARDLLLTEILPVVDNFGVVVAEQNAWDVQPENAAARLQINTLRVRRGDPDLLSQRHNLVEALQAVFERKMRSDRINRLLLRAKITWQDVEVFRSYYYYSRQLGSTLTPEIVQKVLLLHSDFASGLVELFRARFDPAAHASLELRHAQETRLGDRLAKYLDGVTSFDEDRILRTFLGLVRATVRTNFYVPGRADRAGFHYTSFKLDCSKVPDMPSPRPFFEIWVHATAIEGVHLRGGKVARGGLRWSDRLDDFRSEILGLMSTQML